MGSKAVNREYIHQTMEPSPSLSVLLEDSQTPEGDYNTDFNFDFLDEAESNVTVTRHESQITEVEDTPGLKKNSRKKGYKNQFQAMEEKSKNSNIMDKVTDNNFHKFMVDFFKVGFLPNKRTINEEEESIERKEDFYQSEDTKTVGDIKIRVY
jgi:hypothetical protein